jgi:hypothetical protein
MTVSEAPSVRVGDEVEVVLRGEVTEVFSNRFRVGHEVGQRNTVYPDASHVKSIEKVVPPLPRFKTGTVVKAPGYQPFLLACSGWVSTGPGRGQGWYEDRIRKAHERGELTVLYDPRPF